MGFSAMSGRRWISFGTMKMSSPEGLCIGDFTLVILLFDFFVGLCLDLLVLIESLS